jgi:hypothetical protein
MPAPHRCCETEVAAPGAAARESAADLLARPAKKTPIPPRTRRIVPNKLAIPQFIPCASGESLWP